MSFFKNDFELEWLGLVPICAILIYIFYKKANRLLKLSSDQKCVRDECEKIADYFQSFHEKLDDALFFLCNTDVADNQSLSRMRHHCKTTFIGLNVDRRTNKDVKKFSRDFVADFKNSRLFKLISNEDAVIDCQKVKLLVSIEYLKKVCKNISSVFTDVSNKPVAWFKDEKVKKMIPSKLSEASKWLYGSRVDPFFNAEKFNIREVGKYLKACIEQLSDKK